MCDQRSVKPGKNVEVAPQLLRDAGRGADVGHFIANLTTAADGRRHLRWWSEQVGGGPHWMVCFRVDAASLYLNFLLPNIIDNIWRGLKRHLISNPALTNICSLNKKKEIRPCLVIRWNGVSGASRRCSDIHDAKRLEEVNAKLLANLTEHRLEAFLLEAVPSTKQALEDVSDLLNNSLTTKKPLITKPLLGSALWKLARAGSCHVLWQYDSTSIFRQSHQHCKRTGRACLSSM